MLCHDRETYMSIKMAERDKKALCWLTVELFLIVLTRFKDAIALLHGVQCFEVLLKAYSSTKTVPI